MPSLNVNWRGYPHHRLPHIRPTSIRRASITSQRAVQSAAEEVFRTPLSVALQDERRKQRHIVCSRRSRSSRSSGPLARKRVSRRAIQSTQGFEKPIPRIEDHRKQVDGIFGAESSTSGASVGSRQPLSSSSEGTVLDIEATDGSKTTHVSKVRHQQPKAISSSLHVAAAPMNRLPFKPMVASKETKHLETKGGEYTETGPHEGISSQKKRRPKITGWGRKYDLRIDPHCQANWVDSSTRQPTQSFHSIAESSAPVPRVRYPGADDAALWETIDSTRFPPDDVTSSSATIPSLSQIVTSSVLHGSRSEAKNLARFQDELRLYYQAVGTLPKQSLLASPSATTISANTVKELVPYRTEFQAAALAVTSTEQQCTTPYKKRDRHSFCVSRIADRHPRQLPSGHDGPGSFASGTTGTTILGFTPPHEKTYGLTNKDRARGSETGSDVTHVAFTPPHEKMVGPYFPAPARTAPMSSARVSIPWLRGQDDKSPKAPLSPAKMSGASARPNFYGDEKSLKLEETFQAPQSNMAWMPRQLKDKKWDSLIVRNEVQPDPIPKYVVEVCEVAIQTFALNYADAITQTTEITSAVSICAESPVTNASPQVDQPLPSEQEESAHSAAVLCSTSHKHNCEPNSNQSCGWRRRRLPWERPYGAATVAEANCPMSPNDHEDSCNHPLASAVQISDSKTQNENVIVRCPAPCESACAVFRCAQCNACIGSTTESLDGQVQSSSSQELCKPCSDLAYTAYVVPPSRSQPSAGSNGQPEVQKTAKENSEQLGAEYTAETEHEHADEDEWPEKAGSFIKNVGHSIVEFAKDNPAGDPVKRPCLPSSHTMFRRHSHRPLPQNHAPHHQMRSARQYTTSSKHCQQQAEDSREPRSSSFKPVSTRGSSESYLHESQRITNQNIFNGLHVATAAACDKDLDEWLKEVNGSGVRHFLADLSKFEPLGVNALAKVAKQAAKARRERLRTLEEKREASLKGRLHEIQVERHSHDGNHLHRGLETRTDGLKQEVDTNWILRDDGLKRDGKGDICLRKKDIVREPVSGC